jgi:hypothetical protein
MDEVDVYGTFTHEESKMLGVVPASSVRGSVEPSGEHISEKTLDRQGGLP